MNPGPNKLRSIFPHTSVLPKPPQLPYGATYCFSVFTQSDAGVGIGIGMGGVGWGVGGWGGVGWGGGKKKKTIKRYKTSSHFHEN